MPGDQLLDVIDPESGETLSISASQYDPALFDLVPGQQVALSASDAAGASFALPATPEQLAGPEVNRQLGAQEVAEIHEEATSQALHGDTWTQAGEALRGGVSALTGGLSEALVGGHSTSLEREEERARRGAGPGFAIGQTVGEIAGAVAPGIGPLKALKYSPAGLASRAAERIGRGGIARTVAAGAFDGAVAAAGASIAEQAILDRPYSADVLGSNILSGALLGGVGAGLVRGASRAVSKGSDVYETMLTRADDDLGLDTLAGKLDTSADEFAEQAARALDDAAGAAEANPTSWRKLFTEAETESRKVAASASEVVGAVDRSSAVLNAAARRRRKLMSDAVLSDAARVGVSKEVADDLAMRTSAALAEFRAARNGANKWSRSFAKASGGHGQLARGKLPALVGDDADAAVAALSRMDSAKLTLDRVLDEAEDVLTPGARVQAEASKLAQAAQDGLPSPEPATSAGIKGWLARAKERAGKTGGVADVAAGAELLGDATGYRPSSMLAGVPVVGELTSLYLKYRGLRNALGRAGGMASNSATRAATRSADVGDRLRRAVVRTSRGVARKLDTRAARAIGAKSAAKLSSTLTRLAQPADVAEREARAETRGLPTEIADSVVASAMRAREYLAKNRPAGAVEASAFSARVTVNPREMREFSMRVSALETPDGALEAVLANGHPRATVAIDAIRQVYPAIYEQIQADLLDHIDDLVKNRPHAERARLGALFDVPLVPGLMPTAATATDGSAMRGKPAQSPEARRASPSVRSKGAELFATGRDRRSRR